MLEDAEARADESTQEALEATVEPEPAAPEEAAMHVVPEREETTGVAAEPGEAGEPGEEEDISLESIVEELKRREGRS